MSMSIKQIHPHFVGEVGGLDLRQKVTPEQAVELNQALDRLGVLVFRGQDITDEEQLAFPPDPAKGERIIETIFVDPDPAVVDFLQTTPDLLEGWENLPEQLQHTV